jgi:hypothetical protein
MVLQLPLAHEISFHSRHNILIFLNALGTVVHISKLLIQNFRYGCCSNLTTSHNSHTDILLLIMRMSQDLQILSGVLFTTCFIKISQLLSIILMFVTESEGARKGVQIHEAQ